MKTIEKILTALGLGKQPVAIPVRVTPRRPAPWEARR